MNSKVRFPTEEREAVFPDGNIAYVHSTRPPLPLPPSPATNLTERAPLSSPLSLSPHPLPSIHVSLVCRFCLCKARAGKVVSSAFGRLIALAYSTKFGRAVPLSGTDARVLHHPHLYLPPSLHPTVSSTPTVYASLIHLNAHWMPSLSEHRCTRRTIDEPHALTVEVLKDCFVITIYEFATKDNKSYIFFFGIYII